MMHLVRRLFLIALSVAPLGASADPKGRGQEAKCCVNIQLDVRRQSTEGGVEGLSISLKNVGSRPLRFSAGDGPWLGINQIQLVAVVVPGGEPIRNELMAAMDPQMGFIELAPGESKRHVVAIEHLYPELQAELSKGRSDIVLFWTYHLSTAEGQKSERLGGWLMFPSKRSEPK